MDAYNHSNINKHIPNNNNTTMSEYLEKTQELIKKAYAYKVAFDPNDFKKLLRDIKRNPDRLDDYSSILTIALMRFHEETGGLKEYYDHLEQITNDYLANQIEKIEI